MLYRKARKNIELWLNDYKMPILVTGARQVGKTYLINDILTSNNFDFVCFNLIENKQLTNQLNTAILQNSENVLNILRLYSNGSLKDGSIIFIDEVQECKELVTMIKFLNENSNYKFILSGSLLGVELTNLKSAPVGSLLTIKMYPLDFEEILINLGFKNEDINQLHDSFINKTPVQDYLHKRLLDLFYVYLAIGGMPQVVNEYIFSNDLNNIMTIQANIIEQYKADFTKYENRNKLKLINIYNLIPSELDMKNKRYTLANLSNNAKFNRYEDSFNWLNDAGVSIPCYNVTELEIPLKASMKSNLFKLFLSDVGLLANMYGTDTIAKLIAHGENINCGAIYENFVAQELLANGFDVYYYNNKKNGEIDFLCEIDGNITPIEVKSGKDYKTHRALSHFMENHTFKNAFVLSNNNVEVQNNITYYPIYMTMFIKPLQADKIILPKIRF